MSITKEQTPAILSGEPTPLVSTAAIDDQELASSKLVESNRAGWNKVIDEYLVEWGMDPAALEDEDFHPPSLRMIDLACAIALYLRDQGEAPPMRVVPDGNGGISFEFRDGDLFASLNVHPDESIEILVFEDCQLRERRRLL